MGNCIQKILDLQLSSVNLVFEPMNHESNIHMCSEHKNKDACIAKKVSFQTIKSIQDKNMILHDEIITECGHLL